MIAHQPIRQLITVVFISSHLVSESSIPKDEEQGKYELERILLFENRDEEK